MIFSELLLSEESTTTLKQSYSGSKDNKCFEIIYILMTIEGMDLKGMSGGRVSEFVEKEKEEVWYYMCGKGHIDEQ